MSEREPKRKLIGPWRNLHFAVWLIGLAILAWRDWWWPGILILVAISVLLEALIMRIAPHAFVEEKQPTPTGTTSTEAPASPSPTPPAVEHQANLLPPICPRCGGPIRGHEVKWTGAQSADCPYCGANLPMKSGKE
jgi:hypothetical protein